MTPRIDWNDLLVRYHSGELDALATARVEQELQQSAELRQQLESIKDIDQFLQRQGKLTQPPKNFIDRVMYGISLPVRSSALSPKMGLILLTSILALTVVGIICLTNGFFDSYSIPLNVYVQSLYFEKLPSPDFNFPFPSKWIVTTFLISNMAIGFVLLDRTILKPYFQRRAEAAISE
ncbi:MAG: hypothetical protein HYZ44_17545 [Bacteroidetes bacterium]|nr:hypothetical protein [Bacteroidota bacterium]